MGYETFGPKVKAWTDGVLFEDAAQAQVANTASLPIVEGMAIMPDVHYGLGSTVGSVVATSKAIIPACIGVDIGCGMVAVRTTITADQLPDNMDAIRADIERAVPHGRTNNGGAGDRGAWANIPASNSTAWKTHLDDRFEKILEKAPKIGRHNASNHLGSLGGGNHFIEVCLDEEQRVWVMLHSGSRGVGNRIAQFYITKAKEEMAARHIGLPDSDLSYLEEGTAVFDDYIEGMTWGQDFAALNRKLMMDRVLDVLRKHLPPFQMDAKAINCHHNYATKETHGGKDLWITRKGAVNAEKGKLGIIPTSMGTGSFIVEGLGNADSFNSCSHGAGRTMSRNQAKKVISMDEHKEAMKGISARTDEAVLDESPRAYKDPQAVMAAQADLVTIKHTLKQVLCVKG